jgi:hypothetical protein
MPHSCDLYTSPGWGISISANPFGIKILHGTIIE